VTILVVYATTDGQTAKIARELGVRLQASGIEAQVRIASPALDGPEAYDGVIVAASVHARRYQSSVRDWVRRHASALGQMPAAFVSVSLSVLDPGSGPELAKLVARFADESQWTPAIVKHVAGALLYRKYGWLKRWMMRRIVASKGGDTDTSRNYEYTDWNDLRQFTDGFVRSIGHAKQVVRPNRTHPEAPAA
jgi:menaquinone-dependent protoporphyrinogen oxidase